MPPSAGVSLINAYGGRRSNSTEPEWGPLLSIKLRNPSKKVALHPELVPIHARGMNYRELHLKLEIILLFVIFSLKFNLKAFRLQLGEMKLSGLISPSKSALIALSVRCWVR